MNKSILSILIHDAVRSGLMTRLNITETAANQIIDNLLENVNEQLDNGANIEEIATYLVKAEDDLYAMAEQVKAMTLVSDIAHEILSKE